MYFYNNKTVKSCINLELRLQYCLCGSYNIQINLENNDNILNQFKEGSPITITALYVFFSMIINHKLLLRKQLVNIIQRKYSLRTFSCHKNKMRNDSPAKLIANPSYLIN